MNMEDIYNQQWSVVQDIEIREIGIATLSSLEQETIITRLRQGDNPVGDPEISVTCSDQTMITQLKESQFFVVDSILVSCHPRNQGFVLEVRGTLELNGMTIRKKKPVFTEEEREVRAERARRNFAR